MAVKFTNPSSVSRDTAIDSIIDMDTFFVGALLLALFFGKVYFCLEKVKFPKTFKKSTFMTFPLSEFAVQKLGWQFAERCGQKSSDTAVIARLTTKNHEFW